MAEDFERDDVRCSLQQVDRAARVDDGFALLDEKRLVERNLEKDVFRGGGGNGGRSRAGGSRLRGEEREREVAELLELPSAQFTRVQAREIASWYEELKFDRAMIAEAIATASPKKDVRYIGGILKRWYTEGKRTVKDVIVQSNLTAQNVQPVSAENPNAKRVLKGVPRRVPEFKKNEV